MVSFFHIWKHWGEKEFLIDSKALIFIKRNGKWVKSDVSSAENTLIYQGSSNPIRFYNLKFQCTYSLLWYPFDSQRCLIKILPESELRKLIVLQPDKFLYVGPTLLMTYEVESIRFVERTSWSRFGPFEVEIVIRRRLLSIILITFVPTILLNIIGHTSNYFNSIYFDTSISMNVTLMLVLTTMFISIRKSFNKYLQYLQINCHIKHLICISFCHGSSC